VCPYSLDREEHFDVAAMEFSRCNGASAFQVRKPASRPVSQNSAACGNICRGRHTSRREMAPDGLHRSAFHRRAFRLRSKSSGFPRKEVIQPQLPLRLPCYDFTPVTNPTFGGSLLAVRTPTSGVTGFRGVTGGVYKARERIHRGIADPRLLATPPS
jgi:hypothetical protein